MKSYVMLSNVYVVMSTLTSQATFKCLILLFPLQWIFLLEQRTCNTV